MLPFEVSHLDAGTIDEIHISDKKSCFLGHVSEEIYQDKGTHGREKNLSVPFVSIHPDSNDFLELKDALLKQSPGLKYKTLCLHRSSESLCLDVMYDSLKQLIPHVEIFKLQTPSRQISVPYSKLDLLSSFNHHIVTKQHPLIRKASNKKATSKLYDLLGIGHLPQISACGGLYELLTTRQLTCFTKTKIAIKSEVLSVDPLQILNLAYRDIWENNSSIYDSITDIELQVDYTSKLYLEQTTHYLHRFKNLDVLNLTYNRINISQELNCQFETFKLQELHLSFLTLRTSFSPKLPTLKVLCLYCFYAFQIIDLSNLDNLEVLEIQVEKNKWDQRNTKISGIGSQLKVLKVINGTYNFTVSKKFLVGHPYLSSLQTETSLIESDLREETSEIETLTLNFPSHEQDVQLGGHTTKVTSNEGIHELIAKSVKYLKICNYQGDSGLDLFQYEQLRTLCLSECVFDGYKFHIGKSPTYLKLYNCRWKNTLRVTRNVETLVISASDKSSSGEASKGSDRLTFETYSRLKCFSLRSEFVDARLLLKSLDKLETLEYVLPNGRHNCYYHCDYPVGTKRYDEMLSYIQQGQPYFSLVDYSVACGYLESCLGFKGRLKSLRMQIPNDMR